MAKDASRTWWRKDELKRDKLRKGKLWRDNEPTVSRVARCDFLRQHPLEKHLCGLNSPLTAFATCQNVELGKGNGVFCVLCFFISVAPVMTIESCSMSISFRQSRIQLLYFSCQNTNARNKQKFEVHFLILCFWLSELELWSIHGAKDSRQRGGRQGSLPFPSAAVLRVDIATGTTTNTQIYSNMTLILCSQQSAVCSV